MIKLRLNVESVKQQLFECDMTEVFQYVDSLQADAIGTVFKRNSTTYCVTALKARFNHNAWFAVSVACTVIEGKRKGANEEFIIALLNFYNGYCETKSMLTDTIKVEFV